MRKRIHVINYCEPLPWYRVRPSKMAQVFLLTMLLANFLGIACGQRTTDNGRLPAAEIPVHILTENDVGRTVVVESGDWLEFELPLATGDAVWRPRVDNGLTLTKSHDMGSRQSDTGPVQVFRFQTRSVGNGKVNFELLRSPTGTTPERLFSFTIAIR